MVKNGVLVVLILAATIAQSQSVDSSDRSTQPEKIKARLQRVQGYAMALGINIPSALEKDNLPQLRAALRDWVTLGSASQTTEAKSESGAEQPAKFEIDVDRGQDLYPNTWLRWAMVPQFKAEYTEQPDQVNVQGVLVPNPNHTLHQYSVVLAFKQAELLPSDIADIYEAAGKGYLKGETAKKPGDTGLPCADRLAEPRDKLIALWKCLSRTDSKGYMLRTMAGLTVTFSGSQNPQFQSKNNGIILPAEGPLEHLWSGQVDFDPTNLFPNGSDWGSAAKSLAAFMNPKGNRLVDKVAAGKYAEQAAQELRRKLCDSKTPCEQTLNQLLRHSTGYWLAAALVPTFSYKVKTNFDFIKVAGVAPLMSTQSHLWDATFTVDMRRAIETVKSRAAAAGIAKTLNDAVNPKKDASAENSRTDFALDVVEAVATPDVVLDDEWFEKFNAHARAILFPGEAPMEVASTFTRH